MAAFLESFYNVLITTDNDLQRINLMAGILVGISPVVHLLLVSGTNAPYGRYTSASWGVLLDARLMWFLQELPSFIIPVYMCLTTEGTISFPATILISAFVIHYFNRVFVYSFSIRGGKPTPLIISAMAFFFCLCNGYMQGSFLVNFSNYNEEYLLEWNFVIGLATFSYGFYINLSSDQILRNLRKPGETGYKIPHGGMFEYVSAANLWGEAVEWCGWALACWSLQSFAFAVFAVMYLSARSYNHHVWYLKKFDDYPKDRKIFVPFIV
uniref:3-oxo-5alpha-steroid 4-dehydrogenase (NADP(+)) n=1 Tax=Phallusia mammillata TaxID=59560 RepID=A0A6F9DU54_9ASCI|nr:3-oxo-5-alpha-steroid 4-dehydrogenase 1-like [Phallusia mammillata]